MKIVFNRPHYPLGSMEYRPSFIICLCTPALISRISMDGRELPNTNRFAACIVRLPFFTH
ncbi:MAG: hypothetical protein ABSD71_03740 [Bacteroidales bacterium]